MFVGVPLPPPVCDAIAASLAPLRAGLPARWARPDGLHATLCFLGDVRPGDVPQICERAAALVAPFAPFAASLGSAGAFGRGRRPRTAWLGLHDGERELAALAEVVSVGLLGEASAGQQPHVTLAREVAPEDVARVAGALSGLAGTRWTVDAAFLYRSHLGAGGSRYETRAKLPLLARTAQS